jgi:hypothetical protein
MNLSLKLLVNPYERVAGYTSLWMGILIGLCSIVPAYFFNARFDGVLDIHFVSHATLNKIIIDQLVNMFSLMIVFSFVGLVVKGNSFRVVDVCGTLVFSRFPLILAPFLNTGGGFMDVQNSLIKPTGLASLDGMSLVFLVFSTIVLLIVTVWYVTLLYNAYKVSTNAKGWKAVVSFIVAIIIAEVLSKFLIYQASV